MHEYTGHGHTRNRDSDGRVHSATRAIECGTAVCMAGWGALRFRREWEQKFRWLGGSVMHVDARAFGRFFGIHWMDANHLCLSGFDKTAKEKAEELDRIIKHIKKNKHHTEEYGPACFDHTNACFDTHTNVW